MKRKVPVQLRKSKKTTYAFQRLKHCKSCGIYSVLFDDTCAACGKEHAFVPVEASLHVISRRSLHIDLLILSILTCLGIILAGTLLELVLGTVLGLALLASYVFLHKKFAHYEKAVQCHALLTDEAGKIKEGLLIDSKAAVLDVKEERYKESYEKLREIGCFLTDDTIKIRKIMCLNHFVLRKDMDLELETLIPSFYDKDFVDYLWEISKIKKEVIKKRAIDYAVTYRHSISQQDNGRDILVNIAGSALRMKQYVDRYKSFIIDYVEFLPKERLLRLCKLVTANHSGEWDDLYHRTKAVVHAKYDFDPDFAGFF